VPVLREPLLAAARSPRLRRIAERSRLTRPVVDRFVAGDSEASALSAVARLLDDGMLVTLDYLGEDTTSRSQAEHTVTAYRTILGCIGRLGYADRAEVSVKLSAVGQALAEDGQRIALDNAAAICEAASAVGTTVTIDMEDHTTTDATLEIVTELRRSYPWVGAVVQAYLRRTEGDCKDLAHPGSRIRLCKGAYAEPESVAFSGDAVTESYLRCLDVLIDGGGYPMIASHDPSVIAAASSSVQRRAPDSYEFQMLYGVRPEEQKVIAGRGSRMRVYLPYGDEWYGYFMRRLAERPANLALFLRSLTSKR
jgi:proline dehydrogenase